MTMFKKTLLASVAIAVMSGLVSCSDDGDAIVKKDDGKDTLPKDTAVSVVLDDFSINKIGEIGEVDYTAQSALGFALGYVVNPGHDSLSWGGGYWFAYATPNGAKVLTFDEAGEAIAIVDSAASESAGNEEMAKMLGDDSLTFAFDCQNVDLTVTDSIDGKEVKYDYYDAAIGMGFPGDVAHLDGVAGVTKEGDGEDAKIYWNLSDLASITIDGRLQGPIRLSIGTKATGDASYGYTITGGADDADAFSKTITVEELTQPKWAIDDADMKDYIVSWDAAKSMAEGLAIALDSDADTYAGGKINSIKFNFKSSASKESAFPFLKSAK